MTPRKFEKFVEGIDKVENLANNKAVELIEGFTKIEPQITNDLINLAKNNGGKMEGLDFRLKSLESLKRKLITDGVHKPMNDILRYTIILDVEVTKNINLIMKTLENKGYKVVKVKNTFKDGQIYKGVNTNVKSPSGNIFEIQYHTTESFNVKQNINHVLYEQYRLLSPKSNEAIMLQQQMIKNSSTLNLPQNINTIKSY